MILHICTRDDWAAGQDPYRPASLDDAGFVHCSDPGTAHLPATALFRGREDLLLLEIDSSRIDAPLRWEVGDPPHPAGIWFPHVYGPIPREAVVAVHPFPPDQDGSFSLPSSIANR
ncbi:DUF952 domain-containing protein [Amycolatopsis minnesotensis]|uniref:DUF952 domain-containing protein n=1 Tax=Amycolatopsis minnesotensis TaxID=337894 RepID=A0ABN2QKX8_9PSEU